MKKIKSLLEQAKDDENYSSVSQSNKSFSTPTEALGAFGKYKKNLFNLDSWNKAGNLSSYALFKHGGEAVSDNQIADNLFVRISLKGAGKYDWVRVQEISDDENETILTVQPSFDPTSKDTKTISHFFTDEARNNFCLQLNETKVNFYIIGLHEKHNLIQTRDFVEAIRNWVASNAGSYLGIQKTEWENFAENFLR